LEQPPIGEGLPSILQNRPGAWGAVTRRWRASNRAITEGDRNRRDIVAGEGSGRLRRGSGQFFFGQAHEGDQSQITDPE